MLFFRSIAKRNKILIDLPDKNRKFHKRPTPLTGGVSIFTGSILAILIAVGLNVIDLEYTSFNISILICGFIIVTLFLFDDGYGISPRFRIAYSNISLWFIDNFVKNIFT